jgi:hypothetical protein
MSASPECFYTGERNRAITSAQSDLRLFSL